jgi:hypothetical protein
MERDDEIAAFARVAEEYCCWAEAEPRDAVGEARMARRLAVELLRRAIELPERFSETRAPEIAEEEYRRVYKRFGALPFNYYSECFNPLIVPAEEPVVADIADDLADVWRDVKRGLDLWNRGDVDAAAWQWRFHFEAHWGHHISAAIYALQRWFSENAERNSR